MGKPFWLEREAHPCLCCGGATTRVNYCDACAGPRLAPDVQLKPTHRHQGESLEDYAARRGEMFRAMDRRDGVKACRGIFRSFLIEFAAMGVVLLAIAAWKYVPTDLLILGLALVLFCGWAKFGGRRG